MRWFCLDAGLLRQLRALVLSMVTAIALSACGGGGGDSQQSQVDAAGSGADDIPAVPDPGLQPDEDPPEPPEPPVPDPPPAPNPPPVPDVPPIPDAPPVAEAGADFRVSESTLVWLDGYASSATEGALVSYRWTQTAGPVVALEDPLAARTKFLAPSVVGSEQFSFELTVTDAANTRSVDSVDITVVDAQNIPGDSEEFLTWLDDKSAPYVGSQQSAEAYYRSVDPLNEKTSLSDWLAANGFNAGADALAVYRNAVDLGFGRVMSLRQLEGGGVAAYVENYLTLDEAVAAVDSGVRQGLLATVAMEYSPGPSGGEPYTKFYTFGPDDERITSIDLDGRGAKFVPGLCNVCHGGQPRATVAGEYPDAGKTDAQFLPWDLETYEFSQTAGYKREDQESQFRALNAGVLTTYPSSLSDGQWSGRAARELMEGWYGGSSLPNATFDPTFVPQGWRAEMNGGPTGNSPGTEELYLDVIAPNCRACHIMRGRYISEVPEGEIIDFSTYEDFMRYEDVLADLLYDSAEMPDALVTYDQFWGNHDGVIAAERLALHLGIDATARRPGRPVADAGLDREVVLGTVVLNGTASLYADTFEWSFAPSGRPLGSAATIVGADTPTPSIVTDTPGVYRLELVVGRNGELSEPAVVTLMALFGNDPVRFSSDIVPIVARSCASCHSEGRDQSVAGIPVRFDEPLALYERLRSYVNAEDHAASLLLSKPSGLRHGGQIVPGFDLSGLPGSDHDDYDHILQWIGEGASDN